MTRNRDPRSRRTGRGSGRPRPLSVRSRIVVSILAVTALGLAGSGVASYLVQRERALASVDDQLLRTIPDLKTIASGKTSAAPLTTVDAVLRAAMQQLIPAADESVLGFVNGKPALVPAAALPFRIESDPALVRRMVSEANPTNAVTGTVRSSLGTLRYLIVPVSVAGDSSTGLYVAAYNLDTALGAVAESFQIYIMVALIALALVGSVAWFVAGRLLRPIRLLREAAAANTAADLSERIPVTGHDDLSELTRTINGMFERLESSFTSQRRLIDDVGHELKTPITIIRGHLELLDTGSATDLEMTRTLAIDELDRMSRLVSEISLLAESRAPHFVEPAGVDIDTLTSAVAAKAWALDRTREWRVESGASGVVLMDARRITQAWLQLADNAVKYSTAGAPIVMASETAISPLGNWLHLSVHDAGPGIPEDAQRRVFERFGRLESSRGAEGSGLGLAIVSAIAEAHGGSVLLSSSPGEGSTFTIQIPLRGEPQPWQREGGVE
ncbi:MAG: sensor histidine kinase [Lacisediminihabitans sp.]